MKKIISYIACMALTTAAFGQFTTQGKISFERKTSLRMKMKTEEQGEWMKDMIDKVAQFTISNFTLTFTSESSEYEFEKEQEVKGYTFSWGPAPASQNKVFTDFKTQNQKAQKEVFENKYLIEGKLPVYQWKIMDEMRTIAGYPCRKAVTRICDSVVVVAFYCDQLMVSGGPESFNGLPGMILGLAIPRLYTTWFATNVEITPQTVVPFKPLKKSKEAKNEDMIAEIKKDTKRWGDYGDKMSWWLAL